MNFKSKGENSGLKPKETQMYAEWNKKIEILKKSQVDVKLELKNSVTQSEISEQILMGRKDQAEEKMLGPEDNVQELDSEIK